METTYQTLVFLHAVAGLIGLAVFWGPVVAKKGGDAHRKIGQGFVYAMLICGYSGIVMSALMYLAPIAIRGAEQLSTEQQAEIIRQSTGFAHLLIMLGFLLVSNTRHAVLTLNAKMDRTPLRDWRHQTLIAGLALTSANLAWLALTRGGILYGVFAVLGGLNAIGMWRYSFRAEIQKREWLIQHISNICASGVGAHTAFLVFGGRSFLETFIPATMQVYLWIIPGALGGMAIFFTTRHYAKKYRIGASPRAAVST